MKLSADKWILLLVYLLISVPVGVFIGTLVALILIELVVSLMHDTPFNLFSYDLIKISKGSFAGGAIGGVGCWFIYYYNSKHN